MEALLKRLAEHLRQSSDAEASVLCDKVENALRARAERGPRAALESVFGVLLRALF